MIRYDAKIIVPPTDVSLKEVLIKEVVKAFVATQVNHHCHFYGRKCYQCGYWNSRGNECEIITHQDRKI